MKLLEFPFYPFVLFILFPLKLFAANNGVFDLVSVIRLLAFLLVVCSVLFAVLSTVMRSRDLAAYAIATLLIIATTFLPIPVIIVGLCFGAALVGFSINRFGLTRRLVIIANMVSLTLLITPLSKIVSAEVFSANTAAEPLHFGPLADLRSDAFAGRLALPSVVHIVLDAYGNQTALRRIFGHDNSPFSDALKSLGFAVIEDVPVPYNQTLLAMSAVLNADFPPLGKPPLSEIADTNDLRVILSQTMIQSAVIRSFREQGHEIEYTVTGYNAFLYPEYARIISPPAGVFMLSLFDVYFFLPLLKKWGINVFEPAAWAAPLDRRVKSALSLDVVDKLTPPFFLYSHILAPHPPFTIDRDGSSTSRWGFNLMAAGDVSLFNNELLMARYREGYLEKLRYTNKAVLAQVQRMIDQIEGPLVIIIHGDHGSGSLLIQESAEKTCLMERMRTTVAIYSNVPEIRDAVAAGGIDNTVNIYRVIFGALLGTEIPLAEGQYFAKWSAPSKPQSLAGADFERNCER